jgi:hypothetical protein
MKEVYCFFTLDFFQQLSGRDDWTRTSGPNVPNVVRYHLRYIPMQTILYYKFHFLSMVNYKFLNISRSPQEKDTAL